MELGEKAVILTVLTLNNVGFLPHACSREHLFSKGNVAATKYRHLAPLPCCCKLLSALVADRIAHGSELEDVIVADVTMTILFWP